MPSNSVTATRLAQSFSKKRIDVTFRLNDGNFGTTGSDELTVTGLRCHVDITNAGMPVGSLLSLRIEGMRMEDMNRLCVLSVLPDFDNSTVVRRGQNSVTVQAGTDGNMSTAFTGIVTEAFVDFNGAPNIAFQVMAAAIGYAAVLPIPASSYAGTVDAATVLSDLAAQMGLTFQNHGLSFTLHNWYGHGSALEQVRQVLTATGAKSDINGSFLHVWPSSVRADTSRTVPVVSAETDLIGYPAYNQSGVSFTSVYRPELEYWGLVQLQSKYAPAGWVNNQNGQIAVPSNGIWQIYQLAQALDSETPDGRWFTQVSAVLQGNPTNLALSGS